MQKQKTLNPTLRQRAAEWGPLVLAFLIPFLGFVIAMIIMGCEPFGDNKAILYSDEYHQYYPFFISFRNALRSGDSLLHNWQIGMGVDYMGLVSYYLCSPLNLLSVIVPDALVLEYFAILNPLRLGLAGLFFALMLKKLYGKNDIAIALFGSFYALCAWALAYQWNVMWVDSFALLPLVILSTIYLIRDKKYIMYTLTLALSIAANYYVGLFTCIMVMFVFFCYEICRCKSFGRFLGDLGRIALFSVLAIGITAFLELPTLVSLGSTQSSVNRFPTFFQMNIISGEDYSYTSDAWKAFQNAIKDKENIFLIIWYLIKSLGLTVPPLLAGFRQIAGNMNGGILPSFKEGLPNVYSGVSVLFMAFLFLTSAKVKLRDKLCSVFLVLFFMTSFLVRQLDYIMHGFHYTNMIDYRFSYLLSFVVIWMGYRAWLIRDSFRIWHVITAGILSVCILLCHSDLTDPLFLAFNIIALALSFGLFAYLLIERRLRKKQLRENPDPKLKKQLLAQRKRLTPILLAVVMVVELGLNIGSFCHHFSPTKITQYPRGGKNTASTIDYMKYRERDNLFYRAEVAHTQTFNDSALNDYNGITTFTSSANFHATSFMLALGHGAKRTFNRYAFEDGPPVANLFLNLKYMIDRSDKVQPSNYFDEIHSFGDVTLLENNAYLPLGFLAESQLADWDLEDGKYSFERLGNLFRLATGVEDQLWHMSPSGCLQITGDNVNITKADPATGKTTYNTDKKGTITYGYTATKRGLVCIEVDAPEKNSIKFFRKVDGVETELYSETMSLPQTMAVCQVEPGDLYWVEITCKADESGTLDIQSAILDEEVFRKGYDVLAASTLELTKFANTKVEGTIRCNRDGLMYTSIPTNGFWHAEVDGEPAEIVLVGDCMIALEMTEGTHTVSFRYKNPSFTLGLLITIGCILVLVAIIYLDRRFRKNPPAACDAPVPEVEEEEDELLPPPSQETESIDAPTEKALAFDVDIPLEEEPTMNPDEPETTE